MATACATPEVNAATRTTPSWVYVLVTVAVIAIFWLPRLSRGFWVDETGAYWIARDGVSGVWAKLQIYPGQSIIYSYVSALFATSGAGKEFWLRLPSIFGALLGAVALHRLTTRIAGPGTGFLAVIPFCCSAVIAEMAANARPYALSLPVVLLSFWSLREWVHTRRRGVLFLYCLVSPLVVYFHYLFGVIFPCQLLYLAAARRAGRPIPLTGVLTAAAAVILGALPLVWQVLSIVNQSGSWKTGSLPSFGTFASFYPLQALLATAVAVSLFRFLHPKWFRRPTMLPADDLVLLLSWLLLGPVLLFAASRLGGYALFNSRYLLYALLPFFILLAWAIAQVGNERARLAVVVAIALNSGMHLLQQSWTEWRTPLTLATQLAGPATPLLVRSGFVESSTADLRGEPKPASYMFAPLTAYPVPNEIIPVPFYLEPPAKASIETEILRREPAHRRFALVANEEADVFDSLPGWFQSRGYAASTSEVSGFKVVLFEKKP